jgi:biotin operon repressor
MEKDQKIHTGFRLSKPNIDFVEKVASNLGLTRTNVVDMILTLVRSDQEILMKMIKERLSGKI